jgi:hypothetical protein
MLGPVIIRIWFSPPERRVSLGTKRSESRMASITGWRPSLMSITSLSSTHGLQ